MRRAKVFVNNIHAGWLEETDKKEKYHFSYLESYQGDPVSLLMPIEQKTFNYDTFPPFFDGVLPEGAQLTALLKGAKIDEDDLFLQLITVGKDLVGNVTVEEA